VLVVINKINCSFILRNLVFQDLLIIVGIMLAIIIIK